MSALVIPFPRREADRQGVSAYLRAAPQTVEMTTEKRDFLARGQHLSPFTSAWCQQHLPLIEAAVDLLEADDEEFARRCETMRDADGRAMLDELAGQLQRLGAHIADVADALGLTAARIRAGMIVGV